MGKQRQCRSQCRRYLLLRYGHIDGTVKRFTGDRHPHSLTTTLGHSAVDFTPRDSGDCEDKRARSRTQAHPGRVALRRPRSPARPTSGIAVTLLAGAETPAYACPGAWLRTGRSMAARIESFASSPRLALSLQSGAMIAMTTRSSTKVKGRFDFVMEPLGR